MSSYYSILSSLLACRQSTVLYSVPCWHVGRGAVSLVSILSTTPYSVPCWHVGRGAVSISWVLSSLQGSRVHISWVLLRAQFLVGVHPHGSSEHFMSTIAILSSLLACNLWSINPLLISSLLYKHYHEQSSFRCAAQRTVKHSLPVQQVHVQDGSAEPWTLLYSHNHCRWSCHA